ncbi:MAG: glycosyltransferase family 2 protein [Nevskiales bacterium]|nr:glycosyltransferase family 2 protein [Nevskiales bacterium]
MPRRSPHPDPVPSGTAPPLFSILIPTYNRAELVPRALDSVAVQCWRDFEIVVVDDGSTDDTVATVRRWSGRRAQALRLLRQPHGGVHVAYNTGVAAARGALIVVLGSDDQLLPDALRRLARCWNGIPAAQRHAYCGVVGHGLHWHNGARVGDAYPRSPFDSNYLDLTLSRRVRGDKPGAYRRDLLLQHPFPTHAGEPFMRESYVLKRLALDYRTRYVDQAFQYFDYQHDGLSAQVRRLRLSSPCGMSRYFLEDANRYTRGYGAARRHEAHVRYVRYALNAGTGLRQQYRQIRHKGWWLAALPFGAVKSLRDVWSRGRFARAEAVPAPARATATMAYAERC